MFQFVYKEYDKAYETRKYNTNYTTNNHYLGFPPKMSDSRALTSAYQPLSIMEFKTRQGANVKTNNEYRQYLTDNADKIEFDMMEKSLNDVGYYERFITPQNNTDGMNPYLYQSYYDMNRPMGFQESDLKDLYLSREQLNGRKFMPSVSFT
jgi:hypothetical protein